MGWIYTNNIGRLIEDIIDETNFVVLNTREPNRGKYMMIRSVSHRASARLFLLITTETVLTAVYCALCLTDYVCLNEHTSFYIVLVLLSLMVLFNIGICILYI